MSINHLINNNLIKKSPSLLSLNKDISRNKYEFSSEDDLNSSKNLEENFINNNFDTEWKTNLMSNNSIINKKETSFNEYKISNFNFFIINEKESHKLEEINKMENKIGNKINNKNIKELIKRGRKRKRNELNINESIKDVKSHDKFSDDNLRKKCKNIILKLALEFINKKIEGKYKNDIGHGKFKKELKLLNQDGKVKSTVDNEKIFLNKKLKDIFSENISARFYNFPKTHNKS